MTPVVSPYPIPPASPITASGVRLWSLSFDSAGVGGQGGHSQSRAWTAGGIPVSWVRIGADFCQQQIPHHWYRTTGMYTELELRLTRHYSSVPVRPKDNFPLMSLPV